MLYCLMSGDRREQARAGLLLYLRYMFGEGNKGVRIMKISSYSHILTHNP